MAEEPSLDASVYSEFVERLLYMDSVADIQRAVREARNLNVAALYRSMAAFEERYRQEGQTTSLKLLDFVRGVVDDLVRPEREPATSAGTITTVEELMNQAANAPDAVHVYTLLRQHRQLLNQGVLDPLQVRVVSFRPGTVNNLQWVRVLCVVCLLLGDRVAAARGHLFWASHCRSIKWYGHALRHLVHAERLSEGVDDAFLEVGVVGARASIYDLLGKTAEAAESLQKAIEIALRAGEEWLAIPIRERLARCYRTMGRYAEALELIDACVAAARQSQEKEREARCRVFKGLLLEDLGRYEEGGFEYQRAAELAEKAGDHETQFDAMINAAASLLKRRDARGGVERMRETLKVVEGWGNPVMVSSMHNNLGSALRDLGRPSEALAEYSKALSIKMAVGAKEGEVTSFVGIGDASYDLGRNEDAELFYTMALIPALEMLQQSGDTFGVFMYASRVATGRVEMKGDTAKTITWARDIARAAGNVYQDLLLTRLLIEQQVKQGNEQEAIGMYREAIQYCQEKKLFSPEVMRLRLGLAKLLAKGRPQEAYAILTDTLATVEKEMQGVLLNRRRAEIVSEWIDLYGAIIKLLIEKGASLHLREPGNPGELAFNLHEAAKARSFIANLANTTMLQPVSIPQQLREREAQLLALARDLQGEDGTEQNEKSEVYRLERLGEINHDLQACWEAMKPFAPEYVRLRSGEPSKLRDLQSLLASQSMTPMAFVSFFCDEDSTACFVMRSDEKHLRVFRSDIGRKKLSEVAKSLRRAFNGAPGEFPPFPPIRRDQPWERNLQAFEELSSGLLNFLPAIQGVELLCVAPHGPLHLLPLHALRAPDGKFLVEHCAVTYCPSLSTLRYSLEKSPGDGLTTAKPSAYVASIASRKDNHPEFFEHDDQLFNTQVWDITADTGVKAAAKSRVLQQLGSFDVVHLTCHGYFDDKDPLHSGLLLSNGHEKPPGNPDAVSVLERSGYLLTARDFLRTAMHARLVTLRACSTGIQAERNNGDELEGLSRALLYAGNAAVVVGLWNVDQQSSQTFISRFYQNWAESEKPLEEKWRALWKVQKDFLKAANEPFLSHPYHWAPFVLIGNWR